MRAPDSKIFMKITSIPSERGSVLVTALLTITILTLICATSLYVASQNTNAGMQTASWQQALSGAESAADQAFNALNTDAAATTNQQHKQVWANWLSVNSSSLPTTRPSGGSNGNGPTSLTTPPTSGNYYYLIPSNITFQQGVEGNNSVSSWVTIDTAGLRKDHYNNQWYRVRATGQAGAPGRKRVSNERLDNDLRNLSLIFDRKAGGTVSSPVASRTIEVIAAPQPTNVLAYGILMRNSINLQGSIHMVIDSFDSTNSTKSTNGQYDSAKAQSHGDVATVNSTGSNLSDQTVNGNLAYSGPAIQGTGGVTGTISTPFNASVPDTSDPTGNPSATYTGVPPSMSLSASGTTASSPTLVKINGDFALSSGAFSIVNGSNNGSNAVYITIWVTGQFQMSGGSNGSITQGPNVHVTWVVDGNITATGGTATSQNGAAPYTTFIGVGTGTVSIGGNSNFIAALNAPGYNITVSGSGSLIGSVIGNSLNMTGSGTIHYDEALAPTNSSNLIGTFAFASWFEDNGDAARGQTF